MFVAVLDFLASRCFVSFLRRFLMLVVSKIVFYGLLLVSFHETERFDGSWGRGELDGRVRRRRGLLSHPVRSLTSGKEPSDSQGVRVRGALFPPGAGAFLVMRLRGNHRSRRPRFGCAVSFFFQP